MVPLLDAKCDKVQNRKEFKGKVAKIRKIGNDYKSKTKSQFQFAIDSGLISFENQISKPVFNLRGYFQKPQVLYTA